MESSNIILKSVSKIEYSIVRFLISISAAFIYPDNKSNILFSARDSLCYAKRMEGVGLFYVQFTTCRETERFLLTLFVRIDNAVTQTKCEMNTKNQ